MRLGLTIGVVLLAAGALAGVQFAVAQEDELQLDWDRETRALTWTSVEGAVSYDLSGTVAYLHFGSCTPGLDPSVSDTVEVDETVDANTTSFNVPPPRNPAADSIKDIEIIIHAVGPDRRVLAQDGFAVTADKFCDDETVAAELAAAGTGGPTRSTNVPALLAATLALLGSLALAGGVAIRKRPAA